MTRTRENNLENNPTVSVIVSTYNRSALLRECVESVLAQVYKDFELLVIDDGSTDDTREVILSFEDDRIKYFYQENRGNSNARNFAIKKSLGKYIVSIDNDDLWTEDRLSHVAILDSEPDVDIVCCDIMSIDGDGNIVPESLNKSQALYQGNVLKPIFLSKLNPNLVQMMILRRECFDKAGVYDESIKCSSDTDLERRLAIYCSFQIRTEKFYKFRKHGGKRLTDRSFEEEVKEFLYIFGKFNSGGEHNLPPLLLRRSYSVLYQILGVKCLRKLGDIELSMEYFKKSIFCNPFNLKSLKFYFSNRRCKEKRNKALLNNSLDDRRESNGI